LNLEDGTDAYKKRQANGLLKYFQSQEGWESLLSKHDISMMDMEDDYLIVSLLFNEENSELLIISDLAKLMEQLDTISNQIIVDRFHKIIETNYNKITSFTFTLV
ncbi:hypothetical protein ACJX0J_020333, partial [Zea mays]